MGPGMITAVERDYRGGRIAISSSTDATAPEIFDVPSADACGTSYESVGSLAKAARDSAHAMRLFAQRANNVRRQLKRAERTRKRTKTERIRRAMQDASRRRNRKR